MKPLTKTVASRSGGIAARLVSASEKKAISEGQFEPLTSKQARFVANLDRAANTVANPVANVPRYVKWRKANPDLYRERQRAYAKKHRAKKKLEA